MLMGPYARIVLDFDSSEYAHSTAQANFSSWLEESRCLTSSSSYSLKTNGSELQIKNSPFQQPAEIPDSLETACLIALPHA